MITILIIAITAYVSYKAFQNQALVDKMIFYPPAVRQKGWYRLFSYGLLHADYTHLIFNMLTLFIFGTYIEKFFKAKLGNAEGGLWYVVLYITALFVSILPTYIKQKDNHFYRGLGASGAVSAVVFAYILINPMSLMGIMFIPIMLPAFLFGIIYVALSIYLEKKTSRQCKSFGSYCGWGLWDDFCNIVIWCVAKSQYDFTLFQSDKSEFYRRFIPYWFLTHNPATGLKPVAGLVKRNAIIC